MMAATSTAYVAARIPNPLLQDVLARASTEDRSLSSAIRLALRDWAHGEQATPTNHP